VSASASAGVAISHPDKLLFPPKGPTKWDLASYYARVAPAMLPHLKKRPLSLLRCPDGTGAKCFYQKHAVDAVSAAVKRVRVPERGGAAMYMSADSAKALVSLVQWGVIEFHPWGSRVPKLDRPDILILDLDPDDRTPWKDLVATARALREMLEGAGLRTFLKTTGGKGLHVVVPIKPTLTWTQAKEITHAIADRMVAAAPDRFTSTASKAKRTGKIFIDYLRNTEGATAVAPYAVRARAGAPVATPIEWEELAQDVRFDHFNVRNVPARLESVKDPWAAFAASRRTVSAAVLRKLGIELSALDA
jgi:bifunctional non-homologous end joining protein LigD